MRILIANANTTEAITAICAASARAAASPGTEIIAATPRFGPAVISTRAENVIAGHALLELLAQHAGQVDGVILAVSHDTALEAARQMMPCPVVGMTEAACLTACMLGGRFGLVTMGAVAPYRELIADRHGLGARLSGLATIPSTPQDAVRDPDRVAEELATAIASLIAAGAESVILGGAAVAGMATRLQPQAAVPLLDGMSCGIKLIEGLVALNLPKPTQGSYAAATGRVVANVDAKLARLLT